METIVLLIAVIGIFALVALLISWILDGRPASHRPVQYNHVDTDILSDEEIDKLIDSMKLLDDGGQL